MITKYTPGPWIWVNVDYLGGEWGKYQIVENGPFHALWSKTMEKPVFVAQDASSYSATVDFLNEYDAQIIRAAPEMYQALLNIADIEPDPDNMDRFHEIANAAIAKAEGRSND